MLLLALFLATAPDTTPPSGELVLVANKRAASVTIVETATGRTLITLPVGEGPHEVAVSRDGRWALVSNYGGPGAGGSSLTLLDLATLTVARTIELAPHRRPHGVQFIGSTTRAAVTSETSQMLLIVDVAAGSVLQAIPTGGRGSHMVGVTADGTRAWTANIGDGTVTEIDLAQGRALRQVPVATMTEGIGVAPDGGAVWVGSNDQHTVSVVDPAGGVVVATLPAPGFPYRVSISPDGRYAVVPQPQGDVVRVFDLAARRELGVIEVGAAGPVGTAVSPDGRTAYVSLQGTDEVAMIDLQRLMEVRRFPTGAGPDGIAVSRYYVR